MQHTLNIDIETFSSTDLIKSGVYKYVEAEDFEILMIAYSIDGGEVKITTDFDVSCEDFMQFYTILDDKRYKKIAYNANFERTCLQKYLHIDLPIEQWECTMVKASMLGLPLSLDAASKALKLSEKKDSAGKALIRYFSIPCKPTKTNGMRTRNYPSDDFVKWEEFKQYCIQDVKTEMAIGKKIEFFELPESEKQLWYLDQKINDLGILIDKPFVLNAIKHDLEYRERLVNEAINLTDLDNPNSVSQIGRAHV